MAANSALPRGAAIRRLEGALSVCAQPCAVHATSAPHMVGWSIRPVGRAVARTSSSLSSAATRNTRTRPSPRAIFFAIGASGPNKKNAACSGPSSLRTIRTASSWDAWIHTRSAGTGVSSEPWPNPVLRAKLAIPAPAVSSWATASEMRMNTSASLTASNPNWPTPSMMSGASSRVVVATRCIVSAKRARAQAASSGCTGPHPVSSI
jgi:hypothetical protein